MAGYINFLDLEDLTGETINSVLMSQTVPRFPTEEERDDAILTPDEGQLSYVEGVGLQIFTDDEWSEFQPGATGPAGPTGPAGDPATNLVTSVAGRDGVVVLVKADVGLDNVDNTADANKPVSTAQAAAIALKLALTGGNISGGLTIAGDLTASTAARVLGNLFIGTGDDTRWFRSGADQIATDDQLLVVRNFAGPSIYISNPHASSNGIFFILGSANAAMLVSQVSGEANTRLSIGSSGRFSWGNGTAGHDVAMYRHAAAALKLDSASLAMGTFTTAGRPSASAHGAGAQIYDTTLSKPIWSDGTDWRDATGAAV